MQQFDLSDLRKALYVYTMASRRKDVSPEALENLEYRVKKACADIAFPVDRSNHPSAATWEPQSAPTSEQDRLAKGFLRVLEGGKKDP